MLTAFGELPLLLVIIIPYSENPVNQKFQRRRFRRRFSLPFCSDPKCAGGDSLSISFPGSFNVAAVFDVDVPVITTIWLVFLGFLFILTIKLRKSPFDLSYSHHAHQELVKGITTEMSGPTLAKVEIMHWCESVLFLGWVGMFFVWGNPVSIVLGVVVALAAYFLEIWIDNNFARVKWQALLSSAWIVALVAGGVNIGVLMYL